MSDQDKGIFAGLGIAVVIALLLFGGYQVNEFFYNYGKLQETVRQLEKAEGLQSQLEEDRDREMYKRHNEQQREIEDLDAKLHRLNLEINNLRFEQQMRK